jgi:hypothetical protein
MATLSGALTYADWAARVDPMGKIPAIVELLSQTNEIMMDMRSVEGNLPTGHKATVRTGLPTAAWRQINAGVPVSKSTTAPIIATCGNLEAESAVDRDLVKLASDAGAFRLSESMAFLEAMNQQMAQNLIYGNEAVNVDRFTGLAPYYNTVVPATAQSAANVIDAGGTGADNTSLWFVTWGEQQTYGIFPKGSKAGLQHEDKGEWRVFDSLNNPYYALVDHYKWELGLVVKDWRYNVRVCNIDVSDLSGGSAANLINLLVRGVNRLPTQPSSAGPIQTSDTPSIQGMQGQTVIYCNRTLRTYLDLQAMNKTNVLLQMGQWNGAPVTLFRGIPIRTVDAILGTEARVV